MEFDKIKQIRVLHMVIVSAFILLAIVEVLRAVVPYSEFVLAIGFMLCWLLGIRYERRVISSAGVADMSDIRVAERNAASWIFKGEDPEDPRA